MLSPIPVPNAPTPNLTLKTPEDYIKERYEALGGATRLGAVKRREFGGQPSVVVAWHLAGGSAVVYNIAAKKTCFVFGAIYAKWIALGGMAYGIPDGDDTKTPDGSGGYNDFSQRASIYWSGKTGALEVHGAIRKRWLELGGIAGPGYPTTDETKTPDGVGYFNRFSNGGAIYFTGGTGAIHVYGEIYKKWVALGAERSYLGYPVRDEEGFSEDGRASMFQNGGIYFWGDVGAIDLRGVVVSYVGFHCFSETDNDQMSASDEPYFIFGLMAPGVPPLTTRTVVTNGVDDGESFAANQELYRGAPLGLSLGVVLMEHDLDDPNKYEKLVADLVIKAHGAGLEALKLIPVAGPAVSQKADDFLGGLMPALAAGIASAFNFGDDVISSTNLMLTGKQLAVLAAKGSLRTQGTVTYKYETPLLSGDGASYKAYFNVAPA